MAPAAPPPPLPHRGISGATVVSPATIAAPPEDDDHSVYSSVGDFSDDHDFYDPRDASLLQNDDASHSADEHQLTPGRELSDEYEFDDDDGDAAAGAGAHEELVRRNSNLSRLSAQSWLSVDTAEDTELGGPGHTEEMLVSSPRNPPSPPPMPTDAANGGEPDEDAHSPLADPRPDAHRLLETVRSRSLTTKSILECSVELLAGMPAYKKKSFRRFGARRVWLSADCAHFCWTSRKDGFDSDSIKLQLVAKLKCVDREVAIDVVEGYRITILFSSPEEAGIWARCLSCLIPLQAKVRAPSAYLLKDKERDDYSLEHDSFNGVALKDHFSVNSYAVIGPVKGHSGEARLAFSRSEKKFVAVRYIPRRITPLLLRSFEEIAVLKRLSHPNIVRYTECLLYENRGGSFVVFEHQSRGVVMDSSRLEGVSPVHERAARELIRNVISGLEYLHSLQIAHADVRPDNLLRSVNGTIKLNPMLK